MTTPSEVYRVASESSGETLDETAGESSDETLDETADDPSDETLDETAVWPEAGAVVLELPGVAVMSEIPWVELRGGDSEGAGELLYFLRAT